MVRGRALIDSRLDTAKICSDGRVHVDHAQLPAVFGGEKTFSHGLGQNRKSSMRANVFRFTPESGLKSDITPFPFSAKRVILAMRCSLPVFLEKRTISEPVCTSDLC